MKTYLLVALSAFFAISLLAREPKPSFPNAIEVGGSELIKRGEYRYVYRLFFQLYDAALYAPDGASAEDILSAETDFRLQFRYLREIEKSIILKSADRMLEKNLRASERDLIAERVEAINEAYSTVRDGDRSSLTFQRENGTTLRINGDPVVTIGGDDFARLYFQIWLGEQPISKSLKNTLLGD
ncbi:MAG: hypothetical protein GVY36_11495 [Verrucomicrobia bacterium]|nr:hypothetical protein [Verrucomicrobiota bacterium]